MTFIEINGEGAGVRDFLYRKAGGAADEVEAVGIVEDFNALRSTGKRRTKP